MSKLAWHEGPPPHVGWWNASVGNYANVWRWWDGKHWSYPVGPLDSVKVAAKYADRIEERQEDIYWTDQWPDNAVCDRINPETGEVTGKKGGQPAPVVKMSAIAKIIEAHEETRFKNLMPGTTNWAAHIAKALELT